MTAPVITPEGKKALELYIFAGGYSPNGHKATILCEELREAYGDKFDYTLKILDPKAKEQNNAEYSQINPNNKIPAITHTLPSGHVARIFESSAILTYISGKFDPEHKLSFPPDSDDYPEALSWLFWGPANLTAMLIEAIHYNFLPTKIPDASKRYKDEAYRLIGIINDRLKDRDYIAGAGKGKFSVADIGIFPQARATFVFGGLGEEDLKNYPHVAAWIDRIQGRSGVQAGLKVGHSSATDSRNSAKQQRRTKALL